MGGEGTRDGERGRVGDEGRGEGGAGMRGEERRRRGNNKKEDTRIQCLYIFGSDPNAMKINSPMPLNKKLSNAV